MESFSKMSFIDNNTSNDEMIQQSTLDHPTMMSSVSILKKELQFHTYSLLILFFLGNDLRRHVSL
jgi:hypothetical protein